MPDAPADDFTLDDFDEYREDPAGSEAMFKQLSTKAYRESIADFVAKSARDDDRLWVNEGDTVVPEIFSTCIPVEVIDGDNSRFEFPTLIRNGKSFGVSIRKKLCSSQVSDAGVQGAFGITWLKEDLKYKTQTGGVLYISGPSANTSIQEPTSGDSENITEKPEEDEEDEDFTRVEHPIQPGEEWKAMMR